MVMRVKNLVDNCDTNDQGTVVYNLAASFIRKNMLLTLDFSGVSNITSSFVNSSFVQLADDFGYDKVKSTIVIKGVNRQIANILRNRMTRMAA
ncbi:STAS-like domain-containing protein [Loktanella salsilacus]|jgi:hypothetical protein|nr:STAS-like domain-containing protein [Loktanella salsilacus]